MRQVTQQYKDVLGWADIYAVSAMEVKKMIVSQLISEVRVSADYNIEIDFKISERQLGLDKEHTTEKSQSQKNAVMKRNYRIIMAVILEGSAFGGNAKKPTNIPF